MPKVTNEEVLSVMMAQMQTLTAELKALKEKPAQSGPTLGLGVTKSPDEKITGGVAKLPELNNADVIFYTSKKGQNGALLVKSKTETVMGFRGFDEAVTAYIPGLFLATGKALPASQQILILGATIKKALFLVDCCEQLMEQLGVKPE